MARQQRVVWYEGMTLDPHHFQQADRHQLARLNFRMRSRARYDWGFTELQINPEALANGQFALSRCKGVLPDGLVFNIPEEDRPPHARALAELFPATAEKLEVYLVVRREREKGGNCVVPPQPDNGESRFSLVNIEVDDDNLSVNPRTIGVARANLQLRVAGEPLDDFTSMKVAEVKRRPNGTLVLNEDFIPTCLTLEGAAHLVKRLNELLGSLVNKSADFRGQLPFNKKEFTANEITSLWLVDLLNAYIPVLNHHSSLQKCHPEELYLQLLALAGQLTTFPGTPEIRPVDFPRYDHDNLAKCFQALLATIIQLVNRVGTSANYERIGLRTENGMLWLSENISDDTLQNAQIYLACSGDIEEARLTTELASTMKISTPEGIHALANYMFNGLRATYTPRVPAGMPSSPGQHYLRLEKTGDFWEAICASHALAILIPNSFLGLKLELLAMKG